MTSLGAPRCQYFLDQMLKAPNVLHLRGGISKAVAAFREAIQDDPCVDGPSAKKTFARMDSRPRC